MSAPPAPRLPTWFSGWWRMASTGAAIIGAVAAFVALHDDRPVSRALAPTLLALQAAGAVATIPFAMWGARSLRRLQRALDTGVAPEALPREDVLRALRVPWRAFWVVWLSYCGFSLVFVVIALGPVPALASSIPDAMIGAVTLGFISGGNQMQILSVMVRTRISPILLPAGRLDHLVDAHGRLPRAYLWQHLALLLGSLVICWPIFTWSVTRDSEPGAPISFVVLGVLVFGLALFQGLAIMRMITRGSGHIADRMERVRNGDLNAHATVFELDTFGVLASDFNRMVEGLRQRELIKETLGRYVTQQVADEILGGRIALGGELRTATVLFSDIRGFTRMSEKMTPQEVVAFLNEYLAAMVDCVLEHGGVLDKFIGDAVMAVFGAPVSRGTEADAREAVACALAMGARLAEMNARRAASGLAPIEIGIGVHTGELVAGNIGSPKRMEYTVIGDTVNVGSRLESLTKEHKRRTLISAATAELVRDRFPVIEVGTVPVRGRDELLRIYALAGDAPMPAVPHALERTDAS